MVKSHFVSMTLNWMTRLRLLKNSPTLFIVVQNQSGSRIDLAAPTVTFKEEQIGVVPNEGVSGICAPFSLEEEKFVEPHGETTFHFYHARNTNPQTSMMRGIISGFLTS
jgi:hypothetical protein